MINLIKNELNKIFKKKSIYITLLITIAFIILVNIIYTMQDESYGYDISSEIAFFEEQLELLEPTKETNKSEYINFKTELDTAKLVQKYGDSNTWQAQIIYNEARVFISEMNYYQYDEKNLEEYENAKKEYEALVARLDTGDWQYFAKEELKIVEEDLNKQNKLKEQTQEKLVLKDVEEQIYNLETQKQILTWRLEKNIPYGYDYWNNSLNNYEIARQQIREYENNKEQQEYTEKQQYYINLETVAIINYDMEHQITSGEISDARGILLNIFEEFEIFIIIISVMIGGTIVSEEFSKGTVKLLLIKPYKRTTILTAKFVTSIIILLLAIIVTIIVQFVIGGIVQGFDSYSVPAVVYNHNTNEIQQINIIQYLAMQTLGKLPIYILLMTLAFSVSTLFTNSALAITIGLLGYMGSPMVNTLGIAFKLNWLKFFVTPNWDLTKYFWGGLPDFEGLTPTFSTIIIVVYMLIMLIPTYINFKKKNIKNV